MLTDAPIFTFNITPATEAARDRIVAGLEDPALLRGTFEQARDLAGDLGASIQLLNGAGRRRGRIEANGDYSLVHDAPGDEIEIDGVAHQI